MTVIIAAIAAVGVFAVAGGFGWWVLAVYDRGRAVVGTE